MNSLKKYAELKANKQKEMSELVDKVEKEEREMTPEENELFDQLEKDIQSINATVEKINKSRKLTEEDNPSDKEGEEKDMSDEQRALDIEQREIEDFANYIRNNVLSERAEDNNFSQGSNGVIIGTTIANKIIMTAYNMSPILQQATKYNVKGNLEIPVYGKGEKDSDITVAYGEDFNELVEKAGKFTSVSLKDYLVGALAKIGNSLVNNTDVDLVNIVINIIAEYVKMFLEKEALNGTDNKIQGCRDIKQIHEVATPVITYDDLVKLKNKVIQSFRKGSIWVMSQETETALELLKDANDRPLFVPDPTGEFDAMVLGYPVYVSDNMPNIEAGKKPIIFGNFSGLALKTTKELEIQVLREKYATQHATGVVAWLQADIRVEHYQKLAALSIKAGE